MKKLLFSLAACLIALCSVAQTTTQPTAQRKAQKPIIMVVPEKAWCVNNGFVKSSDPKSPDYEKALLNDDVLNVITKMGGIMQERGYPLKNLQSALDELKNESAMDMVLTSKADGEIQEEDLDKLTRVAQADILVSIAFTRQNVGPRQQVEFRITSIDAATNKQIGGETGRSSASGAPIGALLEESVLGFMDNFTASIQRHFEDVIANGREGSVVFKIASDCPLNFESDVTLNGETGELADAIDYWMNENTVNGSYTEAGKTRTRLAFEQVRFPLFGKSKFGGKQKAINMEQFIKSISAFLAPFGLSVSTVPVGIGRAYVVLGGK